MLKSRTTLHGTEWPEGWSVPGVNDDARMHTVSEPLLFQYVTSAFMVIFSMSNILSDNDRYNSAAPVYTVDNVVLLCVVYTVD